MYIINSDYISWKFSQFCKQTVKSGKSVTQEIKRLRFHRRRDLFIYIAKFLIWFTAPLTLKELHFQSSLWTITRCRSKRSLKSLPQICFPERPWNSPLSTSQPICPGFHTVPVRLECSPRSGLSLLLGVGSSAPPPRLFGHCSSLCCSLPGSRYRPPEGAGHYIVIT